MDKVPYWENEQNACGIFRVELSEDLSKEYDNIRIKINSFTVVHSEIVLYGMMGAKGIGFKIL